MRGRSQSDPGPLRGWWWRSSQGQRLVVAGVGTVAGVALLAVGVLGVPTSASPGSAPLPLTTVSNHVPASGGTTTSDPTSGHPKTTTSSHPSTVDTSGSSTTAAVSTTATSSSSASTSASSGPPTTTTTAPPSSDDVQRGVRAGQPCSPEGASGVTVQGDSVTCVLGGKGLLKWRKP